MRHSSIPAGWQARALVLALTFVLVYLLAPHLATLTDPWLNPPHETDSWLLYDYRVMVIAGNDHPGWRWIITQPYQSIDAFSHSQTTQIPGTIRYGAGWRDPSRNRDPVYALSESDWTHVDQWRTTACQLPTTPPVIRRQIVRYKITVRCDAQRTMVVEVTEDDLSLEVEQLLERSANAYQMK